MTRGERRLPSSGREGFSAVEVVLALTLVAVLVHAAWKVFAGHRQAAADLAARAELLDAERTVRTLMGAEVAAGVPRRDWTVVESGVLDLRAFRGWAAVCPYPGARATLAVAYRGLRAPDPSKDSALVLDGSGSWSAVGLDGWSRDPSPCDSADGRTLVEGATGQIWVLDRAVDRAVLARLFERGSYHLTDGVLRYRRGEGGRQPLTAPAFDADATGWLDGDEGAKVVITVTPGSGEVGWTRTVLGNGGLLP